MSYLLVPHSGMKAAPLTRSYQEFTGDDCILHCMQSLTDLAREVFEWNQVNAHQPVIMSSREKQDHQRATTCYICSTGFSFTDNKRKKICEHDHLTGKLLYLSPIFLYIS